MTKLRAQSRIVEPTGSPEEAQLVAESLAAAERILADRGFFEKCSDAALEFLDVTIPFELYRVGAGYTVGFAARRVGMHIADAVIKAYAAQANVEPAEFEKFLKLPKYTKLRAGKDADATERFHRLAKLLAEQLFGRQSIYRYGQSKYGQLDIFKLMRGMSEYTEWKANPLANPGMAALAVIGSATGVPIENVTVKPGETSSPEVSAMSAKAAGFGSTEIIPVLGAIAAGLGVATGGLSLLAAGIGVIGYGAFRALRDETARTRAIHEIAHVIQFEILGSALNDGVITPQDFWQILYDAKSWYPFAGGTEHVADVAAFGKVIGDAFDWYRLKATAHFARRRTEGDLTAMTRLGGLRKHLDNVRELLVQEGFEEEARSAKDLDTQSATVKKELAKLEKDREKERAEIEKATKTMERPRP